MPQQVQYYSERILGLLVALLIGLGLLSTTAMASPATPADPPPAEHSGVIDQSLVLERITWQAQVLQPSSDGPPVVWTASIESQCTGWFADTNGSIVTAGHCVDPLMVKLELQNNLQPEISPSFGPFGPSGPSEAPPSSPETESAMSDMLTALEPPPLSVDDITRTVEIVQPSTVRDRLVSSWTVVRYISHQSPFDGDHALLKLEGFEGRTTPLLVSVAAPQIGEPVRAVGYQGTLAMIASTPVNRDDEFDSSVLEDARLNPSYKDGTISSQQFTEAGASVWEVSAPMAAGMSGGPMLNQRGEVIGVNSYLIDLQPFNFATDHTTLGNFLKDHGIVVSQQMAVEPLTAERWDVEWPSVFAGALGTLMLAAISVAIYMIYLRRQRQPAQTETADKLGKTLE